MSNRQYFWLNANPKYWAFHETPTGLPEDYTIYNESGNKRFMFSCFTDANIGDIVVGYQGTPTGKIVAIYKITKAVRNPDDKEETVDFTKVIDIQNGVTKDELKQYDLSEIMPMRGVKGSLFPLKEDEYLRILKAIEDKNPDILKGYKEYGDFSLPERIEKLTPKDAEDYARRQGTLYMGWNIGIDRVFTKEQLASELQIHQIKEFTKSSRDESMFWFINYKDNNVGFDEKELTLWTSFIFTYDHPYTDEYTIYDFGFRRLMHVMKPLEDGTFQYLGPAEIAIGKKQEEKSPEKGKYRYLCPVYGLLRVQYDQLPAINKPLEPTEIIEEDGKTIVVCGNCGYRMIKAPRCPECGQLQLYKE